MMHLLMAHPGAHVNKDTLSALPLIFRRVLRMPWQKQAAPEVPSTPSGAATVLLANRNAAALGSSFRISLTPEEEAAALAELGEPVLGDRMLSEVRAERNRPAPRPVPAGWGTAWRDGVQVLVPPVPVPGRPPWETAPFAPVPAQAAPRPVNGRSMPSQPRRQPGAARTAGLRDRGRYEPASPGLLHQVLDRLRNMDTPAASYRGGWQ